ncbi:MAG: FAD-dependent oxidoreductase [Thermoproteus sp.]
MGAPRVVVVGGGVAGIYFAYRLKSATDNVEIVVIDKKDFHEFTVGIPMAVAGLLGFEDLVFPFSRLKRVRFIKANVSAIDDRCVRTSDGPSVCGDYLVLAPGGSRLGNAEYWTIGGAKTLLEAASKAKAVRFVVNDLTPVMGFQEIAYSIKTRFPGKEVQFIWSI